jgi:hypothetical protein
VLATSIITAMVMEAANTSETSVNYYQTTRRNNPEDSHLHFIVCFGKLSYRTVVTNILFFCAILVCINVFGPTVGKSTDCIRIQ